MKFTKILLLSFVVLYVETQAQEFVCGFEATSESGVSGASTTPPPYASGTHKMLILFGRFSGDTATPPNLSKLKGRDGKFNQSANDLLKLSKPGSLAHFFKEMSFGHLTLTSVPDNPTTPQAENEPFWVNSNQADFSNYVTVPAGKKCKELQNTNFVWRKGIRDFAREVINNADNVITLTGSDEVVVAVVTPMVFGKECGPVGTALTYTPALTIDGVPVRKVITADYRSSFAFFVGTFAHEYGHVMGLDELFDRDKESKPNQDHSAGIGRWGVMGRGVPGWVIEEGTEDGPNPMTVYSRMEVGWLKAANRLEDVTEDRMDVSIHDINSSKGKAYKIPVPGSSSEYFLVANRQNTHSESGTTPPVGSYYDDLAETSGLAIWHVDENAQHEDLDAVEFEQHKRVDLESADGLFSDKGYPLGTSRDAVAGGDNLDYWSHNAGYRKTYEGNQGDATDLWNGSAGGLITDTAFTPYSNPSTAGYHNNGTPTNLVDDRQIVRTGIAVRNIQALNGGVMQADFHLNYWSGSIATNTNWSGTVTVGGDVTVASGATLTLAAGTDVRFLANTDDTGGGTDTGKSELIVSGTLNAGSGGITFSSTNPDPDTAEWYGVRVLSGGSANLTGATLRNGVRCVSNAGTLTLSNTRFSDCGLLSGAESVSYAENGTASLDIYQAASLEGVSFSWTLSGVDASAFQVQSVGKGLPLGLAPTGPQVGLSFKSAPDFEGPTDQGKDNTYQVEVRATGLKQSSGSGEAIGQVAPMAHLAKDVTVTVTDGDDPGRVSLSTMSPQEGRELKAVLEDDDGVKDLRWSWYPVSERKGASASATLPTTGEGTTTPTSEVFGKRLQAQARYEDGFGTGKQAFSDTTAAVTEGVPSAPELTAQVSAKRVAVSWTESDSNGAWVTSYSVRDSSAGSWSAWASVPGQGTARDTTRTGLTNGREYTFEVRARNRVGAGDSSRVSATPQQVAVSGADSVWYAENRTDTVSSYRVSPSGGTWAWSLSGADSSLFSIASSGRVSFASSPDFERPSDADRNNVHALTVRATPSARGLSPLSKTVAVTVTNVNEAGAISLTPPRPKVNQAITARLSDPDTVASVTRWRWMPYIEGGIGFGGVSQAEAEAAAVETAGSVSSTYTPSFLFRNIPLEVTVFYADRLGSGRQARRVTAAVGAPNRAPTLSGVSDTTFAENDTAAVAAYTGADADGDALSWSLSGADASAFRWQGTGLTRSLRFAAAPDYEAKSTYGVTARVSDGSATATQAVTVTNAEDARCPFLCRRWIRC